MTADDYEDYDADGFDLDERCEMCDSPINLALGDLLECAICHAPGCPNCLIPWDDVYDYLCPECAGEGEE